MELQARSSWSLRLAQDAGLRNAVIAGALRWDHFGEEVLRHDPPIQNTRRVVADVNACIRTFVR